MTGITSFPHLMRYKRDMADVKKDGVCCIPLEISRWDEKTQIWKDKLFLKDEVKQLMHIPLNFGSVVKRMFKKIENAKASVDPKDFLLLAYDKSPWKAEVYMTITKIINDGETAKLSGTFLSKVYDGPYSHVPKWIQNMDKFLATKNKKALKYYFHYAYCPKCAKKYGHNYCIAFAKVK